MNAVAIGSELGSFQFQGWNGSAYTANATGLIAVASENWTLTANGARFQFYTTPNGTVPNQLSSILSQDGFWEVLSTGKYGFSSSTSDPTNIDTCFSRQSAGVTQFDDCAGGKGFERTVPTNVMGLPVCSGSTEGTRAAVTDSNATSFTLGIGAIVAGTGTTHVPVYCDGTNWRIG